MAGTDGNAEVKLRVGVDGAGKAKQQLEAVARSVDKVDDAAGKTGNGFGRMDGGLKSLVGGLGLGKLALGGFVAATGAAAISGVKSFVSLGTQAASTAETTKIGFETMLGSAEKASEFMGQIETMAARTPFEMQGLTTAAQQMLAFGFETEKVLPMLTTLGDTAAGLGAGEEGIDRMTRAMGQIQAKGKATSEDLMQLMEIGVPVWDILAEKAGKTAGEIQDDVSKGLVSADQAIGALLSGMDDRFGGLMDKQADSYEGKMSTLQDTWQQTAKAFMAPLLEVMKGGLDGATGMLEGIKGWFTDVWPSVVSGAGQAWQGFVGIFQAAGDFLGQVWQRFLDAFAPFQPALDRIQAGWNNLVAAFTGLAPQAEGAAGGLFTMLSSAAMTLAELFGTALGVMAGVIADILIPAITKLVEWLGPPILEVVQGVGEIFGQVFQGIGQVVTWVKDNVFAPLFNQVLSQMPSMSSIIQSGGQVIQSIMTGIGTAVDTVKNGFNLLQAGVTAAWNGIKSALSGAASWLKSTFINPVIDGVNSAISVVNTLPGVDIPTVPTSSSAPAPRGSGGGNPHVRSAGARVPQLLSGTGKAVVALGKSSGRVSPVLAGASVAHGPVSMSVNVSAIDGPSVGRFFAENRGAMLAELETAVARGRGAR